MWTTKECHLNGYTEQEGEQQQDSSPVRNIKYNKWTWVADTPDEAEQRSSSDNYMDIFLEDD